MFDNDTITINKDCFVGCMKDLYCPKKFDPDTLSFDQVRALTIGKKSSVSITGQTTKDPKRWLPPESAIRRLADIVQLSDRLSADCRVSWERASRPQFQTSLAKAVWWKKMATLNMTSGQMLIFHP